MPTPPPWNQLLQSRDVLSLIELSLSEDLGDGDKTTLSVFPEPVHVEGQIRARTPTVVCGLPLAAHIFKQLDSTIEIVPHFEEGQRAEADACLATLRGDVRSILSGERVVLNFLMRLCGIATAAMTATALVPPDCRARIFDTRKTTPGWRRLEKAAVLTGGAHNHRFGLFDAVLIKDNHIAAAGSITEAILQARLAVPEGMTVEVEIDDLTQLREALDAHPDIILLDNFSLPHLATAVEINADQCELEASGGVTHQSIPEIAQTGVHRISMGALTHTVIPADLGLDMPPAAPQSTAGEGS